MNGLLEIMTNKFWMIEPTSAHAIRKVVEANLNNHLPVGHFEKKASFATLEDGSPIEYVVSEDGYIFSREDASDMSEPFVNVICVNGPITRNGGACSYGSIDHRNLLVEASDNPNCRGHIFVINTPGGSAWAKNDYQQGIDYARSKGLPVFAFIDGMCASAGMYLAALCDKRFYMHPKNQIGSIGVLCAFYSEKDGSFNQYSNETYHELYDPESYDKNKSYRDIANDDNAKELIEELASLGKEFRADVKTACPKAEDRHLHGRLFEAADVEGVLVDGQSTFCDIVSLCFSTYKEKHPTTNNMNEKYLPLATACGVDELVMTEEGTHLDMSLVDNLTEKLNADAAALLAAEQQITEAKANYETEIAKLKADHEVALASQKAEADAIIENLMSANAELTEVVEKAKQTSADYEQSQIALANAEAEIANIKASLELAQQTISDREEQIKELTSQPAANSQPSPANNGSGVEAQEMGSLPTYDSTISPEENAQRRLDWMKNHGL